MPGTLEKPPGPASEYSCWLPRHHQSVGFARRQLRTFLAGHRRGESLRDSGELILSEFLTNAVLHAKTPSGRLIYLQLELLPASLRIEVHDADPRRPAVHPAPEDAEAGRGLWLVSQLAASWGCHPRPGGIGKVMWALLEGGAR
ncbi:ATP-binding protein [Kitasatospora sp. NPDC053057]|uniref:ATP-binding protein n=1 Tax=Kitasatospora sp. NPDC053057 TaxID=3364062 RepID=UPI0037C5034E